MVDAFPDKDVVSLEHDGLVVRGDPDEALAMASQAAGVEVSLKQCQDPLKCLEEQFTRYDWGVTCKVTPLEYMKMAQLPQNGGEGASCLQGQFVVLLKVRGLAALWLLQCAPRRG